MTRTGPSVAKTKPGASSRISCAFGYGLPRDARDELLDRLSHVAVQGARHEAVAGAVTIDSTAAVAANGYPVLWGLAWRARSASWLAHHRALIRRAVCD